MNPINECSQIRCPFNITTFENCSMTKKDCPYFTRQFTNGEILKAIFPDLGSYTKSGSVLRFKPKNSHYYFTIGEDWWDTLYKGDVTLIKGGKQNVASPTGAEGSEE